MQWFRVYTDIVDNHKLRMLAFEDRWHYIAVLACHNAGILKGENEFKERALAVKLGLQVRELDELKRRLCDVRLVDENWLPLNWDERQYKSDSSTARVAKYRKNKKKSQEKRYSNVTVTPPDTDTDTEQKQKQKKESKELLARVATLGIDLDLWNEYLKTRKRLGCNNSGRGLKVLCTEIEKLVKLGQNATEAVERANSNGWKSVYALDGSQKTTQSAITLVTDKDW